ncbi:MAG: ABC transporter permease, partial [Verrucomicrobiota bacterium]|nr:ABC transporter permease [Verrucomicrobiota bacterium]
MRDYFIRRFLLIFPTLLGISLLVFMLIRLAPGGPVQRDLQQMMGASASEGGGASGMRESEGLAVTPPQLFEIEEKHRRDKGVFRSYLEWLGVLPRDLERSSQSFEKDKTTVAVQVPGMNLRVNLVKDGEGGASIEIPEEMKEDQKKILNERISNGSWNARLVSIKELSRRWQKNAKGLDVPEDLQERAILYRSGYEGLLQGSLGRSDKYGESIISLIQQRIPISLFFGLISMVLIYSICIPLGILKAIKHRTWIDNFSSILVFSGYAIPGYVLGSFLLVFLGANLDLFPLSGFVSENFDELSSGEKILDLFHHAAMPLACYLVGSFAFMTFMMKNNLMDNLAADYVRTAISKGASYRTAVFRHAFRNSIIPIATTIGQNITLIVGGSFLIETIFDINGFGLLQYNAILEKDEPVVLGVLIISAALMLLGNII